MKVDEVTEQQQLDGILIRRVRYASLIADFAIAVARGNSLAEILQTFAEALVRHLDVTLACI